MTYTPCMLCPEDDISVLSCPFGYVICPNVEYETQKALNKYLEECRKEKEKKVNG